MAKYKFFILINCMFMFLDIVAQETEYCSGEKFKPECGNGKIIIMESALYGRMEIGQCIPKDIGYMGCRADVLAQFDQQCSGKATCQIVATDTDIQSSGGCEKGLLRYLSADYICKMELELPHICPVSGHTSVNVDQPEVHLSSDSIHESCIPTSRPWTLTANEGQTMNISLINLQHSVHSRNAVYGSIKDPASNNRVVFGDGVRNKDLIVSSKHAVEIVVQNSDARFIFKITVSGCPNIAPPNDAWMTRDGDVMEVGCHSGDKSWTLKCENNQWVGAVGQCGRDLGNKAISEKGYDTESETVSPNVLVFGVSSLVILLSALIFLTGVCLLKRNIRARSSNISHNEKMLDPRLARTMESQQRAAFNTMYPPSNHAGVGAEPGYKSLHTSAPYTSGTQQHVQSTAAPPYGTYMNSGVSDASDSVKYFVLEDVDAIANRI